MKIILACFLVCFAFLSGCYYDSQENLYPSLNNTCSDTVNVAYTTTIVTILKSRCTTCHYTGATNAGNVILDTYAGVKNAVDNLNLLSSIEQNGNVEAMPKGGGKLDNCQLAAFSKWIASGAPNN